MATNHGLQLPIVSEGEEWEMFVPHLLSVYGEGEKVGWIIAQRGPNGVFVTGNGVAIDPKQKCFGPAYKLPSNLNVVLNSHCVVEK